MLGRWYHVVSYDLLAHAVTLTIESRKSTKKPSKEVFEKGIRSPFHKHGVSGERTFFNMFISAYSALALVHF